MTLIPIAQATNEQLNAAIARLDVWFRSERSGFIVWQIKGTSTLTLDPPDYLHDPRYWAGLLDEYGIGVQPHWDTITERKYWIAHVDIGEQLAGHTTTKCRTPGEAVCLAYLAHKGVTEVKDEI